MAFEKLAVLGVGAIGSIKGRAVEIPTPVNEAIVEMTKRVETGELKQGSANLRLLIQRLQ